MMTGWTVYSATKSTVSLRRARCCPASRRTAPPAVRPSRAGPCSPPRRPGRLVRCVLGACVILAGCGREAAAPPAHPTAAGATVLVAEFVDAAGDPAYGPALTHALALALAEAPQLRILPGRRIADALRAMNRSADERVFADLAWDVAAREGADIIVLGTIAAERDGLLITLDAVSAGSGATLARAEARAAGRDGAIDALGDAAARLLARLPDVPGPPAPAGPLSARVTTSLDALALYARGRGESDRGRPALAAPYYRRALEIDPGFTLARRALEE
jgi:eukaryotic-like serine/threonine-protein kinase